MSIIYLDDEIKKDPKMIKSRILLADTSFVIKTLIPKVRGGKIAKKFYYMFQKKHKFQTNITINQEYFSYIRHRIIVNWAKSENLISKYAKLDKNQIKSRILRRLTKKNIKKLSIHLSGNLEKAHRDLSKTFPYREGGKFNLKLNQMTSIMKKYILDSSDAMIANYGIRAKKYDGIVTFDSDFKRIEKKIDIYIAK